MRGQYRFYAVVIPGLEKLAADELASLSAINIHAEEGGVGFSGTMDTLFRVNIRARTPTRILLRLAKFSAMGEQTFSHALTGIEWARYLRRRDTVRFHVSLHQSRLKHADVIEHIIRESIEKTVWEDEDHITSSLPATTFQFQDIYVRLNNNHGTVSLDTSGERLDRRGYRLMTVQAPLRETIAAAVLRWIEWTPDLPLCVPMCGSGTFAIEAAWMATQTAPGSGRHFLFETWPSFREKRWQRTLQKVQNMHKRDRELCIYASDVEGDALRATRANAVKAGVEAHLQVQQHNVFDLRPEHCLPVGEHVQGMMICNPPYGLRLKEDHLVFFRKLGILLRTHFFGWDVAIFCPDTACVAALALPIRKTLRLRHGGRWLNVLHVNAAIKRK